MHVVGVRRAEEPVRAGLQLERFPPAQPHGLLKSALVELPVQELVRRCGASFERRAQRYADNERLKILSEVQDALITAETANARLRVAREKLARGGVRGQFGNYADVEIRIFRQGGNGITADEGTMLQSGDVVEVRLPYEDQRPSARRPTGRAQTGE